MPPRNTNYIPRPDGDFDSWALQFRDSVEPFWKGNGLSEELFDTMKTAVEAWQAAYPDYIQARAAAEAATQSKRAARAALEAAVRPMVNILQSFPQTTDADRANFGITVRGDARTPAPTPASAPALVVEPAGRLTHELRLTDSATPTRRGKPRGTTGAEVWVALAAPGQPTPTDPALFRFHSLSTKPTARNSFTPADGGKTAAYMARWVSTRGEVGPWSEVATGTVAA